MPKKSNPRIPRKKGQHRGSSKHSDLYTDENPKGTIKGLKFATTKDAKASVSKIKNSGKSHAHKIQAAVAMEQRAKEMGKSSQAAVYRSFINKMKKITKKRNEEINEIGIKLKNYNGQVLPGDVIRAPKGFPLGGKKLDKSLTLKVMKNSRQGTNMYRLSLKDMNSGKRYSVMNFKMDGEYDGKKLPQWSMVRKSKVNEKWSKKYKKSIDCSNPKGFSQKAHCAGKKKRQEKLDTMCGLPLTLVVLWLNVEKLVLPIGVINLKRKNLLKNMM